MASAIPNRAKALNVLETLAIGTAGGAAGTAVVNDNGVPLLITQNFGRGRTAIAARAGCA